MNQDQDKSCLSCLGRDVLEDIALRLEDCNDRIRFSGGVSKEIKCMLWQDSKEMPLDLYRGATWVVKESEIDKMIQGCQGNLDYKNGQILMSKRVVVKGEESRMDDTVGTSAGTETFGGGADGIQLEFCNVNIDRCRDNISKLCTHVLGYGEDDENLLKIPVYGVTLNTVNFGSQYGAMVDILRHMALQRLKILHLKNISVLLSSQDSLRHLEQLEELVIQDAFVSTLARPEENYDGVLPLCLPRNLKRIRVYSSNLTVSIHEWIQLCGTSLAHSCEELVLEGVTCCHNRFGNRRYHVNDLDISDCRVLKRLKISGSDCYQSCGLDSCMPGGLMVCLNNSIENVEIDTHTGHNIQWMMKRAGPSNLRKVKIIGLDWKGHFQAETLRDVQLPYLQELDFDVRGDPSMIHSQLADIFHSFGDTLQRLIIHIPESNGIYKSNHCWDGIMTAAFLNDIMSFARERPSVHLKFVPVT